MEAKGILISLTVAAAAAGACVGSFLNVCIWRIPQPGMSVSDPRRSFCPSCRKTIAWYDNIPVVSWLLLRGRCRHCRCEIRLRYLFVEALTAFAFFVAARYDLLRHAPDGSWRPDPALFGAHAIIAASLIAMSFIDIDHQIIPDELSVPGLAAAPLLAIAAPALARPDRWLVSILGAWGDVAAFGRDRTVASISAASFAVSGLAAAAAGAAGWAIWSRIARRRFEGEGSPPWWAVAPGAVIPALIAGGIAWSFVRPSVVLEPRFFALAWSLAGMALGAGAIYGVGIIGTWVFRKEAMG
ncbi:MAG: prepilin peptidase, partial [Planctomycetes bacterium]|nr:prepilin peptidase [Planctomycetota bacterium]